MNLLNRGILCHLCIGLLTMLVFILFSNKIDYLRTHSNLQYGPNLIDFDLDNMKLYQIVLFTISVFTIFWPAILYLIYADYKNQRK